MFSSSRSISPLLLDMSIRDEVLLRLCWLCTLPARNGTLAPPQTTVGVCSILTPVNSGPGKPSLTRCAPNSPSPRADTAPSDSAAPTGGANVVDVTGGDKPWTTTSARKTTGLPPLCTSKRAASRGVSRAAVTEARQCKKKATKRASTSGATGAKKAVEGVDDHSDQELEDKVAPPKSKRPKKSAAPTEAATAMQLLPPNPDTAPSSRKGFDLTTFMVSFEPGRGAASTSVPTADPSTAEEPRTIPAPATPPAPAEVMSELCALREEGSPGIVTAPNSKGELPPPDVRFLASESFPEDSKKTKGDYNPPQAHPLASSRMFHDFGANTGKVTSAMSFVLRRAIQLSQTDGHAFQGGQ
ncbi:hypothetical protein PI126_g22555 [Phytophthora idaei]|nr:hypothetical protein PI126_g22555 [Phytophthora idaei]